MDKNSKIYVCGHRGLVGTALLARLKITGYKNLIYKTSKELDLRRQKEVENFFEIEQPEYIFLIAAKVNGIQANIDRPVEFLYDNLMIESNVLNNSYKCGVKKLLFLGSSCVYPKGISKPIKEEELLNGKPEPTNAGYAISKIAGIELCKCYRRQYNCNFIAAMPSNLYGENDNFDLNSSHVLQALIRKIHEAKIKKSSIEIWGSGTSRREFLYVEDLINAIMFLMKNYNEEMHINVGTGEDISIIDMAKLIGKTIEYEPEIILDKSKPDGMERKLLDVSKIHKLGWNHKFSLDEGIAKTYDWFLKNHRKTRNVSKLVIK